eukprot:Nk52_evm41s229 gene=Nk52_evmTU41s229
MNPEVAREEPSLTEKLNKHLLESFKESMSKMELPANPRINTDEDEGGNTTPAKETKSVPQEAGELL